MKPQFMETAAAVERSNLHMQISVGGHRCRQDQGRMAVARLQQRPVLPPSSPVGTTFGRALASSPDVLSRHKQSDARG